MNSGQPVIVYCRSASASAGGHTFVDSRWRIAMELAGKLSPFLAPQRGAVTQISLTETRESEHVSVGEIGAPR